MSSVSEHGGPPDDAETQLLEAFRRRQVEPSVEDAQPVAGERVPVAAPNDRGLPPLAPVMTGAVGDAAAARGGCAGADLEGWSRTVRADPAAARQLWAALTRARADYQPTVLSAAEDAVFRLYLPLARSLADASASSVADRDGPEQAAELGLAQAVLQWRGPDTGGFEEFAGRMIANRLRQFTGGIGIVAVAAVPSAAASAPWAVDAVVRGWQHDDAADAASPGSQQ